jgi:hypothetical protein
MALRLRVAVCRSAATLPKVMVSAARTAIAGPQTSAYEGNAMTPSRIRPEKPTALPTTDR